MSKNSQNNNIIKTRQEFIWHYLMFNLESIKDTNALADEKFNSIFQEMYDYVAKKCDVEGDIVDFYMVIERSAE